jgi:Flp pilus assembly protein TadB
MAILLALISTIAAFASVALVIYSLMTKTRQLYAEGAERINEYIVDNTEVGNPNSFTALASRAGLVFLPINETLRDSGMLGVAQALETWEHQLVKAGQRARLTPEQFLGSCQASGVLIGVMLAILSLVIGLPLFTGVVLAFPTGALIGFCLPILTLNGMAADRVTLIEKRLPFAIEFMLLAMEASAAFPQAMQVYAELMDDDPLADEFRAVLTDIERGLSQIDALKAMGARLDSDSVTAFLLAVNIGLDTGQPVKEVLQTQADATRRARFQNAEEIAKTAGTRAIFPLFIVVLGILMLVLGPMAIRVVQGDLL